MSAWGEGGRGGRGGRAAGDTALFLPARRDRIQLCSRIRSAGLRPEADSPTLYLSSHAPTLSTQTQTHTRARVPVTENNISQPLSFIPPTYAQRISRADADQCQLLTCQCAPTTRRIQVAASFFLLAAPLPPKKCGSMSGETGGCSCAVKLL